MKTTYRQTLIEEFSNRASRNPAYSLRAYSRDLGVPASNLSSILKRKRGLSVATACAIAHRIGMDDREERRFVALVELEHGRTAAVKSRARKTLKTLDKSEGFDELALSRFELIANWIYFAILELTHLEQFRSEVVWIAKRLQVDVNVARQAVDRLLKVGLLQKSTDGKWFESEGDLATPTDIPSRYIREHHKQILAKAADTLDKVPVEERDFSALTFAVDASRLNAAKIALREFRRTLMRDLQKGSGKDRVYCLSIQLFPVDQSKLEDS